MWYGYDGGPFVLLTLAGRGKADGAIVGGARLSLATHLEDLPYAPVTSSDGHSHRPPARARWFWPSTKPRKPVARPEPPPERGSVACEVRRCYRSSEQLDSFPSPELAHERDAKPSHMTSR